MGRLALVLSGGGARGAYEAGVIHYIRTALPKEAASRTFEIQCGSSVGAINTAAMVSMADDPVRQGNHLRELWMKIRPEDVYRRDFSAAAHFLTSSTFGILKNLVTWDPFRWEDRKGLHFNFFLDTQPLRQFLEENIPWKQLEANVRRGPVAAVSVTATNTRSGRSELFMIKKGEVTYHGDYRYHEGELGVEQVMASAAIPIIFPTIKIDNRYYADGGLRLFTPISPPIQLGADRIVVVGLRHRATKKDIEAYDSQEMKKQPSMAELVGRLLNGLFLDRIQFDLEQLENINRIIDWSEKVFGEDYLERLNKLIAKENKGHPFGIRGLKKIQAVEILPSEFISEIFGRWFHKQRKKRTFQFSSLEKLLIRLLDMDAPGAIELLSYLVFSSDYLAELMDLGYEDAKRNRDRLLDLMSP